MAKSSYDYDVTVEFSGVSLGGNIARIGFKIDRENINLDEADEALGGKQLKGLLNVSAKGEANGQKKLPGTENAMPEIEGTFESRGFRVSSKKISGGLSIPIESVDVKELSRFVKRSGRLRLKVVGDIAEPESEEVHED